MTVLACVFPQLNTGPAITACARHHQYIRLCGRHPEHASRCQAPKYFIVIPLLCVVARRGRYMDIYIAVTRFGTLSPQNGATVFPQSQFVAVNSSTI